MTRIGEIDVLPVLDGSGRFDPRATFIQPGIEDPWSCQTDLLDEHGRLHLSMGGFLLRHAGHVTLIDAGVGNVHNEMFDGGGMLEDLRRHGVEARDVTDVLFTHLHFDHVGWATQQGAITFPNATYRVHAADWEHFVAGPNADPRARRKLEPLSERLELFVADGPLVPAVDARPMPGHTPGTTIFIISSGGERALLLGDVAHTALELADDAWEAVFDVDRDAARAMRNAIAAELVATGDLAAAAHFPGLQFGRLVTGLRGREWVVVGS